MVKKWPIFLRQRVWNDCKTIWDRNVCLKAFTSVVDDVPCEDISSDVEEIHVGVGKSKKVDYQLVPANGTGMITWQSEDSRIASVSNGVVFGNAAGSTAITGTVHGHSVRIPVTVEERPVTAIVLPETTDIYRNEKKQLAPILTPTDTTDEIKWSSSDPSSVRVDSSGKIFAISDCGSPVTVTATTTSGKMAQCQVTVRSKDPYEASQEDMQSQHPYMTNCETFYEYARKNATGYQVTFSEDTYFEPGCDFLYILNEEGEEIEKYTSDELAGKTISIPCSRIKIKLSADQYLVSFGFQITNIEPLYPVAPSPKPSAAPGSQGNVIVKSMKFKPATKKVKVGEKVKLSRYLKVTKKKSGKVKVAYQFTQKKYKKYATLSKTGIFKAGKKGRKKTVVVRAKAGDDSGKSAKIRVKIR